jgi:hypothetical protein
MEKLNDEIDIDNLLDNGRVALVTTYNHPYYTKTPVLN